MSARPGTADARALRLNVDTTAATDSSVAVPEVGGLSLSSEPSILKTCFFFLSVDCTAHYACLVDHYAWNERDVQTQ